jgi:hypothetical protein
MSDENKPDPPDPIEAARKGIGLLISAARMTLDRLPTSKVEEAVLAGAREVGRVFETVTDKIDEELKKHDGRGATPHATPAPEEPKKDEPPAAS